MAALVVGMAGRDLEMNRTRSTPEGVPMTQSADEGALQEIGRRRDSWIAAINAGDADGFVAVLTEDAVWLPAGQPAISGRDRIRAWLDGPFEQFSYDYSVSDVRVRAGEWAVEQAHFRTRATDRSGAETPVHEGRYTILWRRTPETGWRMERYIDHSAFDAA